MESDQIFLMNGDDDLVALDAAPYENEARLQTLLARYPNLLAGGQINASDPRRWILIGREIGVPSEEGGSGRWSVDHLFVDQDATPTIVEVKRSTNTEIRRQIVGQMLDYAANGVAFWPVDDLRGRFEADKGEDAPLVLAELLHVDADGADDADFVDDFWRRVGDNLRSGRVRLVFVADAIPSTLRRIVEFLNEQMSQTEVLAIELRQYQGDGVSTLVPRVIGSTQLAARAKGTRGRTSFDERLADAGGSTQAVHGQLLDWAKRHQLATQVTPGSVAVLLSDGTAFLRLRVDAKALQLFLAPLVDADRSDLVGELRTEILGLTGKKVSTGYPYVPCASLESRWDRFEAGPLQRYLVAWSELAQSSDTSP